jgi:hypothetical protein
MIEIISFIDMFTGSGMDIPYWDIVGSTMVSGTFIRLTADAQSRKGAVWNRMVGELVLLLTLNGVYSQLCDYSSHCCRPPDPAPTVFFDAQNDVLYFKLLILIVIYSRISDNMLKLIVLFIFLASMVT